MAILALGTCGILLQVVQGCTYTAMMIIGRLQKEAQWPFYRAMAMALSISSMCLIICIHSLKLALPERNAQKWLVGRGLCGAISFTFQSLSVRVGTPAGDAAALASVNTVIAAFAARLYLKEPLSWGQTFAAIICASGAILVSKPKFLFGESASTVDVWLGYSLALAAGFSQAGIAICSRKLSKVSVWWSTLYVIAISVVVFGGLPMVGLLNDFAMQPFMASIMESLGWCMVLLALSACSTASQNAAAQWCPAAVSATVGTGARLLWGYVGEVVVFGEDPELITLSGALLMFLSVMVMALTRQPAVADRSHGESDVQLHHESAKALESKAGMFGRP